MVAFRGAKHHANSGVEAEGEGYLLMFDMLSKEKAVSRCADVIDSFTRLSLTHVGVCAAWSQG